VYRDFFFNHPLPYQILDDWLECFSSYLCETLNIKKILSPPISYFLFYSNFTLAEVPYSSRVKIPLLSQPLTISCVCHVTGLRSPYGVCLYQVSCKPAGWFRSWFGWAYDMAILKGCLLIFFRGRNLLWKKLFFCMWNCVPILRLCLGHLD